MAKYLFSAVDVSKRDCLQCICLELYQQHVTRHSSTWLRMNLTTLELYNNKQGHLNNLW